MEYVRSESEIELDINTANLERRRLLTEPVVYIQRMLDLAILINILNRELILSLKQQRNAA